MPFFSFLFFFFLYFFFFFNTYPKGTISIFFLNFLIFSIFRPTQKMMIVHLLLTYIEKNFVANHDARFFFTLFFIGLFTHSRPYSYPSILIYYVPWLRLLFLCFFRFGSFSLTAEHLREETGKIKKKNNTEAFFANILTNNILNYKKKNTKKK